MSISIRAYARQRGVTEGAVRKAIKSGRIPTEPDGTIDPAKADIAWEQNTDQAMQRGPERPATTAQFPKPSGAARADNEQQDPRIPSYALSRSIKEAYAAKLIRIQYEKEMGKLVDRADVDRKWFEVGCRVRDRIQSLPSRMSAELAAMTDRKAIETFMDQELRNALEELAQ